MAAQLVAAILVAPVLSRRPDQERDPHDGSYEPEQPGQDQHLAHDLSIPPGSGVETPRRPAASDATSAVPFGAGRLELVVQVPRDASGPGAR